MPEIPDIVVYLEKLRPRVQGQVLQKVELRS
jgi:formamidopyrimidine-DNA glycosylase